jgi:toxin FitB
VSIIGQPDLFIAATAALHGLTIVTRDTGDFALTGVAVLNPWFASAAE